MNDILDEIFALVCSQDPSHSWACGGEPLPFCQRCTGLYVGAAIALALHLLVRPPLDNRLRQLHALLLLQMIPFGFHLVPQGAVLRTLSGLLFSFGLVGFLWLLPATHFRLRTTNEPWRFTAYVLTAAASLIFVLAAAAWGGGAVGRILSVAGLAGLAGLGCLTLANLAKCLCAGVEGLRGWRRRTAS